MFPRASRSSNGFFFLRFLSESLETETSLPDTLLFFKKFLSYLHFVVCVCWNCWNSTDASWLNHGSIYTVPESADCCQTPLDA